MTSTIASADPWDGAKKVSGTLTDMTDGSDRTLTVDQSQVGKEVLLRADNTAWAPVSVEISGQWQVDTE